MNEKSLNKISRLLKWVAFLLVFTCLLLGGNVFILFNPLSKDYFQNDQSSWKPESIPADFPEGIRGDKIRYGHQLITETSLWIGPLSRDTTMMYAGNNLSCSNCHLNAGTKIGAGAFVGVANRFPQFRGRENKIGTLEERINGCMERSMNGKALPENSQEMLAMIEFINWLSEGVPKEVEKNYQGYLTINIPDFKADTDKGKHLFEAKCVICHQYEGIGLKKSRNGFTGYLYPPLAGPDSYNDGAGMTRVLTAARFIKGNMPLGATYDNPLVTDEEAYHLAAYINSLERPKKRDKELDFPDLKLKPVSTPYGPWLDEFSTEQHKYGPFGPIIAFYKDQYGLIKTK